MHRQRCGWAKQDALYISYHDCEWGVPVHDDRKLFEFLLLEGAQAGLSWLTILRKRDAYRQAFADFDPVKVAQYDDDKIQELLQNTAIVRNKLKIKAAINNAAKFLEVQAELGSFNQYIWQFVDGDTIQNCWTNLQDVPAKTKESDAMSRDLIKRGFKFVGSTICYAFMQATGMVNDHLVDCFRYHECQLLVNERDK